MSTISKRLLTAEEFWLYENDKYRELVRGEVITTMPPGGLHGVVASVLSCLLASWVRAGAGGVVGVESGFILQRGPDTVRGPDLYYVSAARMGEAGAPTAFWAAVPDLAVEIISPSNSTQQIRERADDFLAAGTPLVWVIDPGPREVAVYRPGEQVKVYGEQQRLECAELPGFSCSVAELFG